jgi:RNA polymerase sigma-70 factor, ECF subfamily
MPEYTDEEIALQVQQGKTEQFGILVERYEEKMTRYARRFFSRHEEIQDLVQTVFLHTYENIRSFDAKRRFSPWIYRIAHNEFVNALKKKKRDPLTFFDMDVVLPRSAVDDETADKIFSKKETSKALEKCLAKLDVKYREPLVLYYFQDLGYKDIAEVLHVPVATIGVRLKRGRALLKKKCGSLDL